MNPIAGLFETYLNVRAPKRSMRFYQDVLSLELGYVESARRVATCWLGGRGEAMLGLWEKPADQIQRQLFAFRTTFKQMRAIRAYLTKRGLTYRHFLGDGTVALHVFGWMPTVHFDDPDGQSLEFITMLPDDPQRELGVIPWERWERPHDRGKP
jgi:hypothetical protein